MTITPTPGLAAFVTIAGAFVVSPGADTMLVIRSVVAHGRAAGLLTACGIGAGCVVHAALAAAGVAAILVQSPRAYEVLKMAGAFYLAVLGMQSLKAAITRAPDAAPTVNVSRARRPAARAFRDGFMTNLLNPKVALFYLAFLPQFIDGSQRIMSAYALLAGIHIALGIVWFSILTIALDRIRGWITSPRTRQWLDVILGIVLIGLGVRLALTGAPH